MIRRVWINESYCTAHGLCVGECPEVFELPAGNGPGAVANVSARAMEFYISHEEQIRSAQRCWPVDAIQIEAE